MKIVVIGGTGLIGSKLVAKLSDDGHETVPAAPNTGVNSLTGDGLADALEDAAVVVDVSNSPSFTDDAVMEFFRISTGNLLAYSAKAGVGHYVALLRGLAGAVRFAQAPAGRAPGVEGRRGPPRRHLGLPELGRQALEVGRAGVSAYRPAQGPRGPGRGS